MPEDSIGSVSNTGSGDEPPVKIRERAFAFSLRAIKLYQHLQSRRMGQVG